MSSIAARSRGESSRAVILIWAAWASFGCDSLSFVPPQPEELREAGGATPVALPTGPAIAPAPTRSIDFVLGAHGADDVENWKSSARSQAGHDRAKLKFVGPAEPPVTQADLVRDSLAHDPRVLVIECKGGDDPPLVRAIEQARSQRIPVVLVGPLPAGVKLASETRALSKSDSNVSSDSQAPLISVAPQPFRKSAQQLVSAAIRNATYAGLDPIKAAIILVNTTEDPYLQERNRAIQDALKAAGVTTITEARFANQSSDAEKVLSVSMKDHPDAHVVFAIDSVSTGAIRGVIKNDDTHRFFSVGCYSGEGQTGDATSAIHVAAAAEFNPMRLMRRAISAAAALAQGREVPPLVEFPINVSEPMVTPSVVKAQAAQWKKMGGSSVQKAKN